MIFASPSGSRSETVRQQEKESYQQDISVCPLATPARRARLDHDRPPLHRRAERHGAGGVRGRTTRGSALTLSSLFLAPSASRSPSVRPDPTPSRACSACSSQPWPSSSSPTA
jgi:hypothetical protein